MIITARQITDARTLLRWAQSTLSRRTALPIAVIARAEASDGEPNITLVHQIAIKHALTIAGIDFTAEPPGVCLRPQPFPVSDEN